VLTRPTFHLTVMINKIKNIPNKKTTLSGMGIALFFVIKGVLSYFEIEESEPLSWIVTGILFGIFAKNTKDAETQIHIDKDIAV